MIAAILLLCASAAWAQPGAATNVHVNAGVQASSPCAANPATCYYVRTSAACANNGDGTAASCAASGGGMGAWKGFSNISWGSLGADKTLNLGCETFPTGLVVGASGTSGHPLTIMVSGGCTATIDQGNTAGTVGIRINGNTYVNIDGVIGNHVAGQDTYGIKIINGASSSGANSYCVYENDSGHHFTVHHVECSGHGQAKNTDSGGGMYLQCSGASAGHCDVAYNWVHSDIAPIAISQITESGTTATVTTSAPHGLSGTFFFGLKGISVEGYFGSRWIGTVTDATHFTFSCDNPVDGNMAVCLSAGLGTSTGGFAIFHWWGTGITLFAADGSTTFNDSVVHDNWIQDMYDDGIRCGSNCDVYSNVVKHIEGSGHSDSLLIQSGGYAQVRGNYVEESADQNIYIDNLYDSICAHIRIFNNVLWAGVAIGNAPIGHAGVNLHAEGAGGAGPAFSTCTTGSSAGLDDVVIANNSFVATGSYNIHNGNNAGLTNVVILDNIFGAPLNSYTNVDVNTGITFASSTAWDYDVFGSSTLASNFGGSNLSLAQVQALSPAREAHGAAGTPTYVDASNKNFHLASGDTAARGKGADLTGTYSFLTTDKDGVARPNGSAWDLGAYQAVP